MWGKEGYLARQQSVEETPTPIVELPSPLLSPQSPPTQTQTPSPGPSPDQGKQQLASSLFVGLGSHNSVCLMGRAEPAPQHFRRKPRGGSSGASERSSDSSHSSRSAAVDNLLLSNLLDSTTVASEGGATTTTTTPQQTSQSTLDHTTSNGSPHVEAGGPLSLIGGNGMVAVVPPTHTQTDAQTHPAPERPRDLPLTSHLPAELSGLARSELTPLCSDQDPSLALSACRVYKEDALVLLVLISNNTDSTLHQMALQLTCKELEISCISGSPLKEVKGHSVSVCLHTVVMKRASVQVELSGFLSYQRPLGQPQAAQFSLSLSLKHFLRPLTVSTGEYGKMWLSFSHDLKQNLRLLTTEHKEPLMATLDALKGKLHFHIVDIIGSEGIVACRLLQGQGQGQPCLLHCRVHADSLAVWLRSPVPELPDSLLYHCQKALTET